MLELHTSCDTDGEEKPNAGYTELWFGRLNIPTMNYGLGLCNIANFGVNIWRNLPVLPEFHKYFGFPGMYENPT